MRPSLQACVVRALLTLWVVLTIPLAARAQEIPTFEGEEVVVSGRRPEPVRSSPAYVTVLSGEQLRRLGLRTVGEALRYLAEVYVRENYSGPGGLLQPSVRGSSPQQVLVLLDGVPLNATAQLGVNLATLSLAEVDRVEVLRGPYSALWGSGALGGVVHVVTRPTNRLRLRAGYGGAADSLAALSVGGQAQGTRYAVGVEHLGSGGYQPNGDASRWIGTLHLGVESQRGSRWTFQVHHTDAGYGVPGATNSFCYPCPDRQSDRRTVLQLAWDRTAADGGGQRLRLWWYGDSLDYRASGYSSSASGQAYGAEWQDVRRLPGAGVLTVGGEWQQAAYGFRSTFGGFDGTAQVGAAFAQYDVPVSDRTLLGLGLRADLHSAYGGQLNPRVGFVHFVTDTLRVRGGVGRTFRGPTFAELYFPGCSNPNLLPESAWSADLGLEYAPRPALVARVNTFYTDAHNLILGGCNPQNVGSARVSGASLELSGTPADGWQVLANLTWTDGVDRTTGLALLRLPRWAANVVLRRELGGEAALVVLASYVGEREDLDFSSFPATRVTLPGYVTVGLRYEVAASDVLVSVGVDNLLDARYETLRGYPAPGRTFFVQVTSRR
ncbi:MAG: TonB-dependent receptor [Armatimonadota bacterium]|nr:TonB-dependent receptor [Armatimonadota bacterium]